jgi:tetratricopeptide (TPR) repeat protein
MMQYEKMMKNIRKANTLDPYDPIWLDRLPQLNSTILAYGEKFIINESYTSKLITYGNNYGNQLLRKGKVDEAIHVYEDLCHFGIRYAQQQPYSIDTITRGAFLFFKSWDNLSPIYKDFDHRDRLKTYSEISGMFLDVYKVASDSFEKSLIYTTHVFDIFFWYSWLLILIIVGIIISTLTWVILGILHKRGKQESFHAAP